jgi:hypothetical protein
MQTPPPTAPQAPGVTVVQLPAPAGSPYWVSPRNPAEYEALVRARSQLSEQVISARERRTELAKQYENASGANRTGLAAQLEVLDNRIVQIESDIAQSGRALAAAPPSAYTAITAPPRGPFGRGPFSGIDRGPATALSFAAILFVFAPMALAASRLMWRRATRPAVAPGPTDMSARFDRLEQAVDAIAIEIERVSEAQRFMTRIMTERAGGAAGAPAESAAALNGQGQPPLALGAGSPEQVFVPKNEQEALRVRRSS